MHKDSLFGQFAKWISLKCGSPVAFILALSTVIIWAISGPMFDYSETWQLIINTGTTIITFLMVFIIQNTQNKDTTAIQIKLDELIRATHHAQNVIMDLEEFREDELEKIRCHYRDLAEKARHHAEHGRNDEHKIEGQQDTTWLRHVMHKK